MILAESPDANFARILNQFLASWAAELKTSQPTMAALAYQWSPAATVEFHEEFAEGLTSFLDESSQFTGESTRSGTYVFLLLAWPEIKVMIESSPNKTLTDLHEWMQPFMRVGVTPYLDIDQLRNVCAPSSQSGIGLTLRPLKFRPTLPSA